MTDLLARLKVAEAGSRELDGLLWLHFFAAQVERDIARHKGTWPRGASDEEKTKRRAEFIASNAPKFSTSLDAALALAERVLPEANCRGFDQTPRGCDAYVSRNNVASGAWVIEGTAPTPALALCIAILKATHKAEGAEG